MPAERVLYRASDGIAQVVLNRPDALNAMDETLLLALETALGRARADAAVGAVIVTGAGAAFSAGADIRWMSAAPALAVRDLARTAVRVNERVESLGKPVIA